MTWQEKCKGWQHDENNVKGFFGDYRWMSNFHKCPVMWKGLMFENSEAPYQAAKSAKPKDWLLFTVMDGTRAKNEGRKLQIREDWEDIKLQIMYDVVLDKILRNKDLRDKLIATGDRYLEETNWWKDRFWGVYEGEGQNHLGKTLMLVRDNLKAATKEELELFN